jgi:hypothetical protein
METSMTKEAPSIRAQMTSALDLMEAAVGLGFTDPGELARTIKLGQACGEFLGKRMAPAKMPQPPRFEKVRDKDDNHVITHDVANGLEWDIADFGGKEFTFEKAKKACAELRTGGHSDWRLPIVQELLTLVDYTRSEPAIDKEFFPNCKSSWYRTSTPYTPLSGCAWFVCFSYGYSGNVRLDGGYFVRAVRASQS